MAHIRFKQVKGRPPGGRSGGIFRSISSRLLDLHQSRPGFLDYPFRGGPSPLLPGRPAGLCLPITRASPCQVGEAYAVLSDPAKRREYGKGKGYGERTPTP